MKRILPSKLYKYRAGTRQDLWSLIDGYAWAASLESLNDPCESIIDVRDDCILPWLLESEVSRLRRGGICSFAQNPLDPRCWAYYAANYSGYCVEYDVEILMKGVRPGEALLVEVQYLDNPPLIDLWASLATIVIPESEERLYRVAQAVVGMKARGWQHEGEWRLITSQPGRIDHDLSAVTGLYLGYKMDTRRRARISRRAQQRGIPLFEVTASKTSYQLQANSL